MQSKLKLSFLTVQLQQNQESSWLFCSFHRLNQDTLIEQSFIVIMTIILLHIPDLKNIRTVLFVEWPYIPVIVLASIFFVAIRYHF